MLIDVALRRFSLGSYVCPRARKQHVKFYNFQRHALFNPGNRVFSYCATLNTAVTSETAVTLDTDETPDSAAPTKEPSDKGRSTGQKKHVQKLQKFLQRQGSETDAHMRVLPRYLRNAVLGNRVELKSFNWKTTLDSLDSSSEKIKVANSLLWFIRKRIEYRMWYPVKAGLVQDRTCLPMKRLNILLDTEKFITSYIERYMIGRKAEKRIAKMRTVTQLPETVERALVSKEFLEAGWLERTVKNLEPDQQREVIKSTIENLTDNVRDSIERDGLHVRRHRLLAFIAEAKSLYTKLNPDAPELTIKFDIKRNRNPFTRVSYTSFEEEHEETLKWQTTEQERLNRVSTKFESATYLTPESRKNLQDKCNEISMKLRAVERFLEKLELENAPMDSRTLKFATKRLTMSYRAQHHILKDVLGRFKVALFDFGQRLFPNIMQREGWYEPEGLSLVEFGDILVQHRNMHDIHKICNKQWESLRRIRNSAVHDIPQMSVQRLEELLDDVKDLAYVMECPGIDVLVDKYTVLLNRYKDEYIDFLTPHEEKLRGELKKMEHERTAAFNNLETRECEDFEQSKIDLGDEFSKKRHVLISRSEREDRARKSVFARDLVRHSILSHIRHCLDSEDDGWAAEATGALANEFAERRHLSWKSLALEVKRDSQD